MNAKYLIPLIVFLGVSVFLGVGLTLNPTELPSTMINKTAPAFSLPLLAKSEQPADVSSSDRFSPADYLGKRWILNVWASWCVSCRYEHPLFNEIAEKTTIPLVGLNYKDKDIEARAWLQQRGNPYDAVVVDSLGDAGIDWGVYGVPETFVIDENGIVIYKHPGPVTAEIVKNDILPLFDLATNKGS